MALPCRAAAAAPALPPQVAALVAAAKKAVNTVDMQAFKRALDAHEPALVIDVREPDEFTAQHIPGAINIPRGVIEFKIWPHVGYPDRTDTSAKLYLYCASGSRCMLAAKSLQDLGFTRVYAVDMALKDWQAAGYPLEPK